MMRRRQDGYEVDLDPDRLDLDRVHQWLSTDAYWALGRDRATVAQCARSSVNFGVYQPAGGQVGYARVVTDLATFAWLADVYVDRGHRGIGLGGWLAAAVRDHLAPYRIGRVMLVTADAHELYARVGFVRVPEPDRLMVMHLDR